MCEVDNMKKRLISSYDEINDTFVGKVDGEHGYCADYGISESTMQKSRLPLLFRMHLKF